MREVTRDNFGLLIAYLLPGFVALWGAGYHVEAIRSWLSAAPTEAPTVGGFLYATLGSTAAGLIASAVRWAVIDRCFAWAGLRPPAWDFGRLAPHVGAFEAVVQNHYRYYQFYANTLVALGFAAVARLTAPGDVRPASAFEVVTVLVVVPFLVLGARDALGKYYARSGAILRARVAGGGARKAASTRLALEDPAGA